ncbi:MAG: DUF2007 domain-containing protein [Alphaproteobacteria bacterium]|nr:DUF2007 domain-containing protein [Alphaproteobacteria bacterium]
MKAVLTTNNAVELGWAETVLAAAGIRTEVFDRHASVTEGSIGALPRRLMVPDRDLARATAALQQARAALDRPDADA